MAGPTKSAPPPNTPPPTAAPEVASPSPAPTPTSAPTSAGDATSNSAPAGDTAGTATEGEAPKVEESSHPKLQEIDRSRRQDDDPPDLRRTANPMNDQRATATARAYPDVDKAADVVPGGQLAGLSPKGLVEHLERHAAKSHGLSADTDLIKATAAYLRHVLAIPTDEDEVVEVEDPFGLGAGSHR